MRKSKLGKTYPTWLKAWKRTGEKWPQTIKIVVVHWTDAAYSEDGVGTIEAIKVGFIKAADEDSITLAMEGFEDQETRTHISVPAKMVNRVIEVADVRAFGP